MGWLDWMRRSDGHDLSDTPINVEQELALGLTDRTAARRSVARLKHERKSLLRRRRAVERGFKRLSRARTALIARSSRASLDLQVYPVSEAIRDENAADRTGSARKEQIAAIEEIDRAIVLLREASR